MIMGSACPALDWGAAHCWSIRVYFEDTDAGGIVFYANYLKFMERARTEWLRELGVEQQTLAQEADIAFVVSQLDMKYRLPAKLDDLLTVQTSISQYGRASLNFTQRILRFDTTLAEGQIRVGCVRLSSLKPTALPDTLLKQFFESDKR
jgi:acyl-CoA thioester hydrolase